MKFDYKNIDFLVLLPCPMKAAFGIIANQISIEYTARTGNRVNFLPVSGMDVEVIHDLMSIENAEDFPAVMMIPGMGIPYSKRFMEKFRNAVKALWTKQILHSENMAFMTRNMYMISLA